ncbi:mitochondrial nicotinamide adenine dinucleotide transporter SLC25A51-like [Gigantopelta aegis]|uniref:mitochondrial nicotinamide adenine dinucleotide transporter SLC25A51-like n=1 Tax=Gigantopelta aegis TaxID=1735272 RepID=UPI001B888409|nr:mitochondrial nicotinamide adenine dinucleotide transporter SLC25A51-like [Gigantopelta aegis]XP_041360946.1 mitochondrial nicotinamide adenine dinucleotide transporter SLC25A51-like [Gigantopelta aegis]XP_041360947.1 mitochondrial nicotinamide adenine dinucleotide transporter SLC25A51-like [Gigantopelta aegis]
MSKTVTMYPAAVYHNEYSEFICGWGAAFVNITATFPLNKAMFRQQLYGISGFRAIGQLQREGLRNLYRGVFPPLLQKTTSLSLMFGMYYRFQRLLCDCCPQVWKPASHATAAFLAGTVEATLAPFERVQTLLQDRSYTEQLKNTRHAFMSLRGYGLREYYRGLTPILMRNGPSNIMFFLGRDYLKEVLPLDNEGTQKLIKDFTCGALLGAFISTLYFPLNVVKTRMQSQLGGQFVGFFETFRVVMAERHYSIERLFRGYHLNYMRSFLSWGIINMSYEFFMQNFFRKTPCS